MGIRQDQCNKVCRIIDDYLANRPRERDELIIAVRTVFKEADRKTELQIDCQDCKYVWWNSEAKRYECQIEKCPYSQKTENSSEKPNNSKVSEKPTGSERSSE